MTRIAVDCMGGDYAPEEIVKGCLSAYKELGIESILVGDEEKIRDIIKREGFGYELQVVNASDVV